MKTSPAALLSLIALAAVGAATAPAHAAPPRDEALARRMLFCANVADYWAQSLTRAQDTAHVNDQLKLRELFVVTASYLTNADFLRLEQPAVSMSVRTFLSRQRAEQQDLIGAETRKCEELFRTQATPLLQQRMVELQAAAAASAPVSTPH